MSVQRGATALHTFVVDIDLREATEIYISYSQLGKIMLEKIIDDCTVTETEIVTQISQKDSLKFKEGIPVKIQIRAKFENGSTIPSTIIGTDVGQCVGGGAGASLAIGQRVYANGNVNCIVAADVYNTGNGNAIFGRQHISRKNRSFLAGTGHDTSNAGSESVSAVGQWSDLSSSETLFAVGDGTDHTSRSNAFEVRSQAFVLKSPNGTKWKITVDNNGNLTTTAL